MILILLLSALWVGFAFSGRAAESGKDTKEKKNTFLPDPDSALFVTSVEGKITLTWKSAVGKEYTIIYTERLDGTTPWKIIPQYANMPGTGAMASVTFREPAGHRYHYRLQVRTASPPKKKP